MDESPVAQLLRHAQAAQAATSAARQSAHEIAAAAEHQRPGRAEHQDQAAGHAGN